MLINFVCKSFNNLLTTVNLFMYGFFLIILIHFITFVLIKIDDDSHHKAIRAHHHENLFVHHKM